MYCVAYTISRCHISPINQLSLAHWTIPFSFRQDWLYRSRLVMNHSCWLSFCSPLVVNLELYAGWPSAELGIRSAQVARKLAYLLQSPVLLPLPIALCLLMSAWRRFRQTIHRTTIDRTKHGAAIIPNMKNGHPPRSTNIDAICQCSHKYTQRRGNLWKYIGRLTTLKMV